MYMRASLGRMGTGMLALSAAISESSSAQGEMQVTSSKTETKLELCGDNDANGLSDYRLFLQIPSLATACTGE